MRLSGKTRKSEVVQALDAVSLAEGLHLLAQRDSLLAQQIALHGLPPLRRWPAGFSTLLNIIIGQQVSTASAQAIRARLEQVVHSWTPLHFLETEESLLRQAGLSRQKIIYCQNLAQALHIGSLKLQSLEQKEDEEAIADLVRVKGIGRWTAENYLLFALGRPDVWPSADRALQVTTQYVQQRADIPSGSDMVEAAESYRPWRGAVAHLFWHIYRKIKRNGRKEDSSDHSSSAYPLHVWESS